MKYNVSITRGLGGKSSAVVSLKVQCQWPLEAASEVEKLIQTDQMRLATFTVLENGIRETFESHLLVQAEAEGSIPEIYRIRHVVEIEKIEDDQS